MTRRRPILIAVVAALAAVLVLAACGSRKNTATAPGSTTDVNLVLDFFPNADHAGLYAAIAGGDFADVGLNVTPRAPADAASPLKLLLAGRVDLAISYEPEVFLARDRGAQLVSVAAIVQRPLTSIISVDRRITRPAQLAGRTVGTAGIPYQSAYLRTILEQAGKDAGAAREVNVGFNLVPAMLGGKVDATLGGFWNYEGVQLTRERKRPAIIPVDKAGVPTYDELVLVARAEWLKDHGATVRRFVQGLRRGTEAVRADPNAGVDPLLQANPDLDRGLQRAAVAATTPVWFPAEGKPFGWQAPAEWKAFGTWMYRNGLLRRPPTSAALTNEFLPGQGL